MGDRGGADGCRSKRGVSREKATEFIGAQGRVHRLVLNIHKKLNVFLSDMVVALIAGGA